MHFELNRKFYKTSKNFRKNVYKIVIHSCKTVKRQKQSHTHKTETVRTIPKNDIIKVTKT